MQLVLRDPSYTERLASFLTSVGQAPIVAGPTAVELPTAVSDQDARLELEVYLRVWRVLYPDTEVRFAA